MTIKSIGVLAAAGAGLFALALPLTLTNVHAQAGPGPQGPPPVQGRPGQMGGGPVSMVADQGHLFIMQGNRLFKVDKGNLQVVAQGQLPVMRPEGAPGQPNAPRRGGGGPPPEEDKE